MPVLARLVSLLPEAPREGMRVHAEAPRRLAPADRLRLLFPPQNAMLAEDGGPVTLRAAGGRRPLAFLVDGAPVPHEAARREAAWVPPGPGFYRVTVLDAEGRRLRQYPRPRGGGAGRGDGDAVPVGGRRELLPPTPLNLLWKSGTDGQVSAGSGRCPPLSGGSWLVPGPHRSLARA